jgi:hypothetical protein
MVNGIHRKCVLAATASRFERTGRERAWALPVMIVTTFERIWTEASVIVYFVP